jgi:glycosyltransferase involved in cell wall biosynthesis
MIIKNQGGLTVGIPTRNAEWCLPNCLRTLKLQTIQPDEYVICIGKSQDRTEEIVKEFVKNIGVPVKIIYDNEGIGTGYARKNIIEVASQEYLYWVDSDVILPKNIIETVYFLINTYKFDILNVTPDFKSRQITMKRAKEMYEKNEIPQDINISQINIKTTNPKNIHIFKRSIILEAGNYDPFFTRGQDEDLDVRLKFMNIKSIMTDKFFYLHSGVLDQYSKMLISQVYLKFLYKYGFRFAFFGGDHTELSIAFFIRTLILVSMVSTVINFLVGYSVLLPLFIFISLLSLLFIGVTLRYGFRPKLYVMQFFKCFGEYYVLYMFFKYKNLEEFGYGWKQTQRLIKHKKEYINHV